MRFENCFEKNDLEKNEPRTNDPMLTNVEPIKSPTLIALNFFML